MSSEQIQMLRYEDAIISGNIPYIERVLENDTHYDVPILHLPPYELLDTVDGESLIYLYEQGLVDLPTIVVALLYDDPYLINPKSIDSNMIRQIITLDDWNIYTEYQDIILAHMTSYITSHSDAETRVARDISMNRREKKSVLV
jgi:hypothetical protein